MDKEIENKKEVDATLDLIENLLSIVTRVDRTTLALNEKRITLEDRMVRHSLHRLCSSISGLVAELHKSLSICIQSKTFDIESETIQSASLLAHEIAESLSEFHRIVEYDWNFLEQYYIHGFAAKLSNEYRFDERVDAVKKEVCRQLETREAASGH